MAQKSIYEGVVCSCCGQSQAKIKGLCMACYQKKYHVYRMSNDYIKRGPNERKEAIKRDLEAGMRQCEVARKYEVSRQYVGQIWKKMEVDKYAPR